jgi:NifU-like protein involved in Fe-S cluster formation
MSTLYSPAILRLALACADFPLLSEPDARVERRAPLCGSRITLDLRIDARGQTRAVGFAINACAVGQAAAALLAREVSGRSAEELAAISHALARWLDDPAAAMPDWPGIDALAPVRALPARRGAALLPFEAAAAAAADASRARAA